VKKSHHVYRFMVPLLSRLSLRAGWNQLTIPCPVRQSKTCPIQRNHPQNQSIAFRSNANAPLVRESSERNNWQKSASFCRAVSPSLVAFALATAAHAQGSIDMSGATTLMTTFKTFAMYAGAVICLGSLIFAGVRLMSGRFQDAIPGLFGALFGAGVLGWGAGWISSLTGQSIT